VPGILYHHAKFGVADMLHASVRKRWICFYVFIYVCLARSANLPEGLYILPMFFLYFFIIFLMVDFLAPVAQTLMEQSSPKFQDW